MLFSSNSKHADHVISVSIPHGFIVESFPLQNPFSQDTLSFTPLSLAFESSTAFFYGTRGFR
jgi:hypothetical protein